MLRNTSCLLGDATTGIVSTVECGFDGEVAVRRVFTMWFCSSIRVLALTRSGIELGRQWFVMWWVLMLGWSVLWIKMGMTVGSDSY